MRTVLCLSIAAALLISLATPAIGQEFENPKAKVPPQAKPSRISGGESFPPLPLPATPLRRTERKREPSPPALVGEIKFGQVQWKMVDGERVPMSVFPSVSIDIEALMQAANHQLKVRYRFVETRFAGFSYDPAELPVLYFTGWKAFPGFGDAETLEKLRRFLYDGGTLVIDSSCGRPEFNESVTKALAELLPNRQLALLPSDHPIYHCYHEIDRLNVRVGKEAKTLTSANLGVYGIHIGSRAAVIFCPIDLSVGWDAAANPIEGGTLYEQRDAVRLGANIVTYALADFEYARSFATEKVYFEKDDPTRDQLVIAQVVHNGDWDPTPHGLPNLLKFCQDNSTLNVQFKRQPVNLADLDVFKHPILYMTGLRDFQLNKAQAKQLGNYLRSGGVLLADAATGSRTFDFAFRQMVTQALGEGAKLELLKPDHPLFTALADTRRVELTDIAKKKYPDLQQPLIEAVTVNGRVAVIYSRLSLGNGWEQLNFPYNVGYTNADALKLGANALVYAMTGH